MTTRRAVAVRHYYIGGVTGAGLVLMDTKPLLGATMLLAGVAAQVVSQWRVGNEDLRAKGRAS